MSENKRVVIDSSLILKTIYENELIYPFPFHTFPL